MRAITAARADGLTIGKLSRLTGVNIETIRYYEKIKVLPAPLRADNGRRVYGAMERRILAFVRRSRELGFSLDEIRTLMRLGGPMHRHHGARMPGAGHSRHPAFEIAARGRRLATVASIVLAAQ